MDRGANWKYTEDLMRSFFAYGEEDHSMATIAPGTVIDMTTAGKSSQYKDGNWKLTRVLSYDHHSASPKA